MLRYWPAITTAFLIALSASPTAHAAPAPNLEPGIACPHCVFTGRDLTNQCMKGGNLTGADFDDAKLVVACMSYANFRDASFRGADLTGANLSNSKMDGADLSGANLSITTIKGTDFRLAKGLTQAQLNEACGDAATRVPTGMTVKRCE